MSIILAPVTGGVRCSTGPAKESLNGGGVKGGGGRGDTIDSFSVRYP